MSKPVLPYKDSELGKKQQIRKMFDSISGRYDGLNRIITLGTDQLWRRRLVRLVAENQPERILDVATGTGGLALALTKTGAARIIGLDLAPGMLEIGRKKVADKKLDSRIEMVVGDSEALEFPENHFDAVTVAFGVRNFEHLEKGLSELLRVLKPGGTLAILETSVPRNRLLRWGYGLYGRYILPTLGKLFSGEAAAYHYLSESAASFPHGQDFNNILGKIGFIGMKHRPQSLGVAAIYTATKA